MDRLLRAALQMNAATPGADCPGAADLAAFAEGALPAPERERLEIHFSGCSRCQDALAAMADMSAAAPEVHATRPARLTFRHLRWLVPAGMAASALALYLAVQPPPPPTPPASPGTAAVPRERAAQEPAESQSARSAAPAMPGTVAGPPAGAGGSRPKGSVRDESLEARGGARALARAEERRAGAAAATGAGVERQALDAIVPGGVTREAARLKEAAPADSPAKALPASDALAKQAAPPAADPTRPAEGFLGRPAAPVAARPLQSVAAGAPPPPDQERQVRTRAVVAESVWTGVTTRVPFVVTSPDGAVRWQFGSPGTIRKSIDRGATWLAQPSGTTSPLLAANALAPGVCWAVGRGGTVVLTTDGERWETRPFPERVDLILVEARDARNATVSAIDGRRFTTSDGGATWTIAR